MKDNWIELKSKQDVIRKKYNGSVSAKKRKQLYAQIMKIELSLNELKNMRGL